MSGIWTGTPCSSKYTLWPSHSPEAAAAKSSVTLVGAARVVTDRFRALPEEPHRAVREEIVWLRLRMDPRVPICDDAAVRQIDSLDERRVPALARRAPVTPPECIDTASVTNVDMTRVDRESVCVSVEHRSYGCGGIKIG